MLPSPQSLPYPRLKAHLGETSCQHWPAPPRKARKVSILMYISCFGQPRLFCPQSRLNALSRGPNSTQPTYSPHPTLIRLSLPSLMPICCTLGHKKQDTWGPGPSGGLIGTAFISQTKDMDQSLQIVWGSLGYTAPGHLPQFS